MMIRERQDSAFPQLPGLLNLILKALTRLLWTTGPSLKASTPRSSEHEVSPLAALQQLN